MLPAFVSIGAQSWILKRRQSEAFRSQYKPDFGAFSAALRRASILDNRAFQLAGASVVMPFGMHLLNRYFETVKRKYLSIGLEEYSYPSLLPSDVIDPTRTMFDLDGKLLHVATADQLREKNPYLFLAPTGESGIYTHWRQLVRTPADLPIRMFQRAKYFRPVPNGRHSGRGPFYAFENSDIFEFHCCYETREELELEFVAYQKMLADLCDELSVPVLWSTRPPWTNNQQVAEFALAADAPIPTGGTTQVAALYFQGTRFSEPYSIRLRTHNGKKPTHQLAGYVSRRLLLVHLLHGLQQDGTLRIHPDVTPTQVALMASETVDQADTNVVRGLLDELEIRYSYANHKNKRSLDKRSREARDKGIPVVVMLFGRRGPGDPLRAVLMSGHSVERALLLQNVTELTEPIQELLRNEAENWEHSVRQSAKSSVIHAQPSEIGDVVETGKVAMVPLAMRSNAVVQIEKQSVGEVLGFVKNDKTAVCSVTSEGTSSSAFISRRS